MVKVLLGNLVIWCCVAVTALGLLRTLSAPEASARVPPLPARESLAPLEIVWPNAGAFAGITERPLFTQGRRPPAPVTPTTAPQSVPDVTLVGIIRTRQEHTAMAAVADETLRLRTDDTVAGWSVKAIDDKSMTLRNGREEYRIWLGEREEGPAEQDADQRQLTVEERMLATFGSARQNPYGPDN